MAQPKLDLDVEGWAQGLLQSAQAGRTVWSFLQDGMNQIAVAGTGTATSELHGAAQTAAREAYLGGGTIASGGGGRALGDLLSKAAVVGVAVGVGGAAVYEQGEKAMTEAEKHRTAFGVYGRSGRRKMSSSPGAAGTRFASHHLFVSESAGPIPRMSARTGRVHR
ncbi:MAG TPA: hypothetical protein VFG35_06005 [Actinoplanes sp.]|nr:hypothetical protein [Actinoplanes sp.]